MEEKLNGVVIGAVNYGENDKILSVFTLEKGVVSARIKGVKKAGAKLKFAAEPFCFAEYVFIERGGKRSVKSASVIESFYPIRTDIVRFYSAATVIEFVKKFFRAEMVSAETFSCVITALKNIAFGENAKCSLVAFLLNALKYSGYALNLDGCVFCGKQIENKGYFDCSVGGFCCSDCYDGSGREINVETYSALCYIERGQTVSEDRATLALRLIDYYVTRKTDETLTSLKELLK